MNADEHRWKTFCLSAFICVYLRPVNAFGRDSSRRSAFARSPAKPASRFVLENSPTDRKHLIETMPGGIAVFDYDGDGRPDIYFTNGADIPSLEKSSPKYWNRLYRNEGNWKFRDVTEQAGVAGAGYSMGAAAADFDNDGHPDLFVAGVNRNILYRNLRQRHASKTSPRKAGIQSGEWAVAAGWFDYDRDGKLDLWVVHYAKWSTADDRYCGDAAPRHPHLLPSEIFRRASPARSIATAATARSKTSPPRRASRSSRAAA